LHDPCAEVDEVLRKGRNGSSYEANGNSAILSIRGALTETSGDFIWRRMLLLVPRAEFCIAVLDGNGKDVLRVVGLDFFVGVRVTGSWKDN
jgi:hypothetical protein